MGQNKLSKEHKEVIGPAELYERDKVPTMFRPLALFFLDYVPIEKGIKVLDVACGTGIVARLVSERIGSEGDVVGVDIDQEMIKVARAKTPPQAAITWHVGSADSMPFLENNSFDWAVCQQGFQYFSNKLGALREMHRVLKPNGGLAMIIWMTVNRENQPYQWAKVAALRKFASPEAAEKQLSLGPFYDGDEDDLRILMQESGFREFTINNVNVIRKQEEPEKFIIEEDYADLDPETRKAVVSEIRKSMEPYRTAEGTSIPYGAHLVIGYK